MIVLLERLRLGPLESYSFPSARPLSNALALRGQVRYLTFMVLSNAERQKRFQQRLRAKAAAGVNAELVRKAARLNFDEWARDGSERLTWVDVLASARKRGEQAYWTQWVPADIEYDYAEFGSNAPMMRAVAAVAHAILSPPKDSDV